jgi:hypothetical protein
MSRENVALFVRMLAEKRDLSRQASADRTTSGWVRLGKSVGLDYDDADVVGFVGELTGARVTATNAVSELLAVIEDRSSEASPTAAITFTADLARRLVSAGYTPPGTGACQYVSFPPDPPLPHPSVDDLKGPQVR